MRVKIGNQIFDSSVEPILLIMEGAEKVHISGMLPSMKKYLIYPSGWFSSDEEARKWMEEE